MRVSIVQGAGMMPIVITTTADSAALTDDDADALRAKVEEAGLLDRSGARSGPQPDRPSYEITVEDEGRRNDIAFDDADLPDTVRSLIAWVGSVPGHERRIDPPGTR
ncbi:MAG: protealysin inhibitor emfourin [Acidimicrobiales bacterium]